MSPAAKQEADPVTGKTPDEVNRPEGWRPEPGDELTGKIVDLSIATSTQRDRNGNYPQYPLLLIQEEDGHEVFVHCFHQTLQKALLERRPEIGHRIRIKFHGKQTLKSDSARSVAIYSLDLPDTPRKASDIYDRLEAMPARRTAPRQASDDDLPWDAESDDGLGV